MALISCKYQFCILLQQGACNIVICLAMFLHTSLFPHDLTGKFTRPGKYQHLKWRLFIVSFFFNMIDAPFLDNETQLQTLFRRLNSLFGDHLL